MRCPMTKEEIVKAIVSEFEKCSSDLDSMYTERNLGRYVAMMDLLQAVPVYLDDEDTSCGKD